MKRFRTLSEIRMVSMQEIDLVDDLVLRTRESQYGVDQFQSRGSKSSQISIIGQNMNVMSDLLSVNSSLNDIYSLWKH